MAVSYDLFVGSFLAKISEFDFAVLPDKDREVTVDGYLKRAVVEFNRICKYDLVAAADDNERSFNLDIADGDLDEIVNIISEGMVVQWLKPFIYRQELLENVLNTFSVFGVGAIRRNKYLLNCWNPLRAVLTTAHV